MPEVIVISNETDCMNRLRLPTRVLVCGATRPQCEDKHYVLWMLDTLRSGVTRTNTLKYEL